MRTVPTCDLNILILKMGVCQGVFSLLTHGIKQNFSAGAVSLLHGGLFLVLHIILLPCAFTLLIFPPVVTVEVLFLLRNKKLVMTLGAFGEFRTSPPLFPFLLLCLALALASAISSPRFRLSASAFTAFRTGPELCEFKEKNK